MNNYVYYGFSSDEKTLYLSSSRTTFTKDIFFKTNHKLFPWSMNDNVRRVHVVGSRISTLEDMSYMFYGCESLAVINLHDFDTSNVVNMSHMFHGCERMLSINMYKFDTANVKDMSYMFYGCKNIGMFNIAHFDTKRVINMSHMFYGCAALFSIDLRNFNMSSVQDISYMFSGCSNLVRIYITDEINVIYSENVISGCTRLFSSSRNSFMNKIKTDAYLGVTKISKPRVKLIIEFE